MLPLLLPFILKTYCNACNNIFRAEDLEAAIQPELLLTAPPEDLDINAMLKGTLTGGNEGASLIHFSTQIYPASLTFNQQLQWLKDLSGYRVPCSAVRFKCNYSAVEMPCYRRLA